MSDPNTHDDLEHTVPLTHRYDDGFDRLEQGAEPAPSRRPTFRILVAALVAGGLGGLAGAAGLLAVTGDAGDGGTQPSDPAGPLSANVATSEDPPAEDGTVEQVAGTVLPSVVKISVTGSQGAGSGSGVVLSSDGQILTNNHVVDVADGQGRIAVSFADGSSAAARILGTDPLTDLAVIQAEDVSGLTPATIGRSGQLDVGEQVVAIGSPFGLESTVTSGIVSALARPVSAGDGQDTRSRTTYPAIQTDAAINPGNSGGPLVNMRGEVVGINSSIRTAAGGAAGSIGLGFAIPIDNVLPIVEQLRNGETPTHARLGVSVSDTTTEDGLISGARVEAVEEGSAADEAGLEVGDVITRVDDVLISDSESLVAIIRGHRPGDEVTLELVPGGAGERTTLTATLDSDEGTPSS